MSVNKFVKELNGKRVEGELIKSLFYSLISSFIILGILYFTVFNKIDNFMPKYGFFLFFAALSFAICIPTIKQIRANKHMNCMSGMMVGMTMGMMSGFLAGFLIGATNGMFFGGVFGMIIGCILGIWMGSCCGVMGFMEGLMAGFMGGWMGAMTSVMLINDHLKAATVIVFIVCSTIMFSLNYMIYLETRENERERKEGFGLSLIINIALLLATIAVMVYGPRSALLG